MSAEYTIHWPRWQGYAGCLVGAAFLYALLDVHCLHHIPANPGAKHDVLVNVSLGLLGMAALFFGARAALRPPALLSAGRAGVTVFSRGMITVPPGTRKPSWTRRRGEACLIPWEKITSISRGTMYWIAHEDSGRHARQASALLIACDPAIQLEAWGYGNTISVGMGPGTPEESEMWPGSRVSGHEGDSQFVLNARYVPGGLDKAVAQLLEMKRNYA